MKRIKNRWLPCLLLAATLFPTCVHALDLSPALSHIAAQNAMVKTGNAYTGILFSREDFINATSCETLDSITVTAIPEVAVGTLYLGSVPIVGGQNISGENLDKLKFVPQSGVSEGSFSFSVGGGYSMDCHMHVSSEVNFAPVAGSATDALTVWTQRDISSVGTLDAYDPDGDRLVYEITEAPKKGLLVLSDVSHGDFRYTPYVGCSGEDSFRYRVRDSYGNYSEIATARVMISRADSKLVFADMTDHWAHSAAIEMVKRGIMDYDSASGMPVFAPDETVSREEFLVMVMKSIGYKAPKEVVATVFADNDSITPENRAYVSAAYNAGIIRGREENGVCVFSPQDAITRAETAVMLNNMIGAEVPLNVSLFTDNASVPTWAQSALYALNDLGILRGTGAGTISPYASITRAQASQLLLNFMLYLEK